MNPFHSLLILLSPLLLAGCMQTAVVSHDDGLKTDKSELRNRVNRRMELASAYFEAGQYATALQEADRVIAIKPDEANAHGLRGLSLMQLGDDNGAQISLLKALHLEPDSPDHQNNMGWFVCERQSAAKAMPYFQRALSGKSYTSPAKALVNAGMCSSKSGDVTQAESYFLRAIQHEPGLAIAHASLAKIYYDRADYNKARSHILMTLQSEQIAADHLLMAIQIERKLGDRIAERSLLSRLRRLYPDLPQTANYLSGETDDR